MNLKETASEIRDILLKKISAIRKKDLNFDTIQSDLIAYLNEVIKA